MRNATGALTARGGASLLCGHLKFAKQ